MKIILNYGYAEELHLEEQDIFDLLIACQQLHFITFFKFCVYHIIKYLLKPETCITFLKFAGKDLNLDHSTHELYINTRMFILRSLKCISDENDSLLCTKFSQLMDFLEDDYLYIENNEEILKW